MKATLFEFRHRWWFIFAIFFLAFSAYDVDHVSMIDALARWGANHLGIAATRNTDRAIIAFGALLVALGGLIRTWGTSYLRAEVMRDSRVHTERLLADGPYRYVRNPLYIGNILLAIGAGLMASRIGFLILVVGMTVFVMRLILREEADLARDQGESYRSYCAAVPRILPALTPRVPSAGNRAYWGQGFRAEIMYWLIALAMAAFAVTLNVRLFWAIFAVATLTSLLAHRPVRSNKEQAAAN